MKINVRSMSSVVLAGSIIGSLVGGISIGDTIASERANHLWENRLDSVVAEYTKEEVPLDEWSVLQLALAKTESEFNETAKGKCGDYGILQITNIYVKDVNRILGEEVYQHGDAFDPEKSIQMFDIYQNNYNPKRSVTKAIKLHNPNGESAGYPSKVRKNMDFVRKYESVRRLVVKN